VNTLPGAPAKLERLARRMGYPPAGAVSARDRFLADYAARTGEVHEVFLRVFEHRGEAG
jgi:hypothetical protein